MDQGYSKEERLRRQWEIDDVYRRGRRWSGKGLRIHVRPNGLALSRFAVSVPGRLCGAVQRNRWKRLLRESFRLNKGAIGPGLDIIAVPTQPPGDLKQAEVGSLLIGLVGRHRGVRP